MPKNKRGAKSAKSKQSKSSGAVLSTVLKIQRLVEDQTRWNNDEETCLRELESLVDNLDGLQCDDDPTHVVIPNRTEKDFEVFTSWLGEHGLDLSTTPFRFGFVEDEDASEFCNATLYATRDIEQDELIVSVPSDVMMSADMAPWSSIAPLLEAMPTLKTMPSITLALMLLAEAIEPSSKFQPYIRIMPSAFTIPFGNFRTLDLLAMKPSAAADGAIKSLRAQLRNYTYVYCALVKVRQAALPVWAFSYVNYVWAVSIVMTRQNALPIRQPAPLALVPVWDMCNHAPGQHTTSVVIGDAGGGAEGKASVECRAMRAFECGEAVTIFYGARPNQQLLLFSGFVQEGNVHDVVGVAIFLSAQAELAAFKARLLGRASVEVAEVPDGSGWMCVVGLDVGGDGVAKAVAVCRVIGMDKAGVSALLKSGEGLPIAAEDDVAEAAARDMARAAVEARLAEYEATMRGGDDRVGNAVQRLIGRLHAADVAVLEGALVAL